MLMVIRRRLRVTALAALAVLLLPACTEETTTDHSGATGTESESEPESETSTVPGIPDAATAGQQLGALAEAPEGELTGYDRDLFPHWTSVGGCSTRETVLARDGSDVVPGDDCYPESGSWHSAYDGETLEAAPDVDIDHVVPLAEAWRSGAAEWTTDRREAFANDLDHSQLIAVSAASNRSKGDQDPADWEPPLVSFHCTYARMWIGAKYTWDLTVDPDEHAALEALLGTC